MHIYAVSATDGRFKIAKFHAADITTYGFYVSSPPRTAASALIISTELLRAAVSWLVDCDLNRRTGSELTVRLPHFDPGDYERFAPVHVHLVTNRL